MGTFGEGHQSYYTCDGMVRQDLVQIGNAFSTNQNKS